jgi:dienelactone hydrolase
MKSFSPEGRLIVSIKGIFRLGCFSLAFTLLSESGALCQIDSIWVSRYNGTANGEDKACAIALDHYGNIYVTGTSRGSGTLEDYTTIKYDPYGDTLWARRYNGLGNLQDYAYAIALDDAGNVYVTGESYSSGTNFDYATIKYDASGNEKWVKRYDGLAGSEDCAQAIALDGWGNIYVTGFSSSTGTNHDYATIKYYLNGDTAWIRRYDGASNSSDQAVDLAVDSSGNVCVTGFSWGGLTSLDYLTVRYDSSGNLLWSRRYNGPANGEDRASAIAVDDSNNVYVTGYSTGAGTLRDYATIKYRSDGDTAWISRYDGPANDRDQAKALVVDYAGNVYVTGFSWASGTNLDFATIKYLTNGDTGWVRRYNGPINGGDNAEAITVDAFGNVYVTGGSEGSTTSQDYLTIKYYPNGDTAWVRRYDGEANDYDQAAAIAVFDYYNVFVTGHSWGNGTSADYLTIRYGRVQDIPFFTAFGLIALIILLIGTAVFLIGRN